MASTAASIVLALPVADPPEALRIRGWLVLPALGLPSGLIGVFVYVQRELLPLFAHGTWRAMMNPSSPQYHLRWGLALIYELVAETLQILLLSLTIVFFFQRRRFVPKLIIAAYLASLAFAAGDYFMTLTLPISHDTALLEVARAFVISLIWIPYFWISVRVRRTFVR